MQSSKRPKSLPVLFEPKKCYITKSINRIEKGCYDSKGRLAIDGGYGDYNMSLFRLKDKRKFIREVPSVFTAEIKDRIIYNDRDESMRRIVTEHNENINKIISEPK